MASNLCILVLTTLAVLVNADTDYCNIETCEGPHTLCTYPFLQIGSNCGVLESSELTDDEKEEILDTHNKWRAFVASGQETRGNPGPQPAASNLGPLEWDDELAGIAQTWANQCIDEHDNCEDVERFPVNQNIAYKGTTADYDTVSWTDLMTQWYKEVDKFDRHNVDSLPAEGSDDTLHYTQLMWAETKYVGCGGVRFNNDDTYNKVFLVCNYGPGGNYATLPVYKTR